MSRFKSHTYLPLLLLAAMVFSSGCASIVSESTYMVRVDSMPTGAKVAVADKRGDVIQSGVTPMFFALKSSDGFFTSAKYHFTFSKDGHLNTTTHLNASLDEWYIGNCIFGGLIGMLIVDPLTGAMWRLPDKVSVTLTPNSVSDAKDVPKDDSIPSKSP